MEVPDGLHYRSGLLDGVSQEFQNACSPTETLATWVSTDMLQARSPHLHLEARQARLAQHAFSWIRRGVWLRRRNAGPDHCSAFILHWRHALGFVLSHHVPCDWLRNIAIGGLGIARGSHDPALSEVFRDAHAGSLRSAGKLWLSPGGERRTSPGSISIFDRKEAVGSRQTQGGCLSHGSP